MLHSENDPARAYISETRATSYVLVHAVVKRSEVSGMREKITALNATIGYPDKRVSSVFLGHSNDEVEELTVVRRFESFRQAKRYAKKINRLIGREANKVLLITQQNYRLLLSRKDWGEYEAFYAGG